MFRRASPPLSCYPDLSVVVSAGKLWFVLRGSAASDETWLAQGGDPLGEPPIPCLAMNHEAKSDRQNNPDSPASSPSPELPQETTLTIRLPVSLKEALKVEAESRGSNLSDFVRSKLSGQPLPVRRCRQQLSRVDCSTLAELNRIGVNLNQAVRKLNSQDTPRITPSDRQLLKQLLQILEQVEVALTAGASELQDDL